MSFAPYDLLPDPVLIHHRGKWIYANDAAARMLRVASPAELAGRDILQNVPPDLYPLVQERTQHVSGGAATRRLEQQLLCDDGTILDVSISGAPFVLPDGESGVLIVVHDITALRRAEQLLRESEQRFRTMIESAYQLVLLVSPAGTIEYISASVRSILGYEPDEVLALELFDFFHPEELPLVMQRFSTLAGEAGGQRQNRLRLRDRAGAWRQFDISAVNLLHEPSVGAILVHARDVSEQVELTSDLERLKRIDSLGRVAANVAHEFNNLLMAIAPYGELLMRRAAGDPQLGVIGTALTNTVARGRRLVEQIRQFGKGVELRREPFELARWLEELRPALRELVPGTVQFAICVPANGVVQGDPHLLAQVLINLVINARDATPAGGAIEVAARFLPRGEQDRMLDLEVSDTGAGIPPDRRDQIFDPFFTTKKSGTGLGLAVVQQIIAAHGGRVLVDSAVGRGTRVSMVLPV